MIKVDPKIMKPTLDYLMCLYRASNSETSVPAKGLTFNEWLGQLIDEQVRVWKKDDEMMEKLE